MESTTENDASHMWNLLQEEELNCKKIYQSRLNSLQNDWNIAKPSKLKATVKSKEKSKEKSKIGKDFEVNMISSSNKMESETENTKISEAINEDKLPISTTLSMEEMMIKLARHVSGCNSDELSVKKKSLQEIYNILFIENTTTDKEYTLIFHEIGKFIFHLFTDKSEKCRELSLTIVQHFFNHLLDATPILSYFFSKIMQRIPSDIGYDEELQIFIYNKENHEAYKRGKAVARQDKPDLSNGPASFSVIESSEEIRYLGCKALNSLILQMHNKNSLSVLHPYFHEIILYLQVASRDPFPLLKILALETLDKMTLFPEFEAGMKHYAVALVRVILPTLRFQHAKVRICAITTLTNIIMIPDRAKRKGAGSDAIVDLIGFHEENVLQVSSFYSTQVHINYLAELVIYHNAQVREQVANMLSSLLTKLPDRYDHVSRLLPYLLDCLTDERDNIVQIAMQCLDICGYEYEQEHLDDVLEKRQYGVDGDSRMNIEKQLPYPFLTRPKLGIRLFVRAHAKRFLQALISELTNWQSKTRLKSVQLLKIVIILTEESITIESSSFFPAFLKAMYRLREIDRDPLVFQLLLEVNELLGRYINPDVYVHYLLPRLKGDMEVIALGTDSSFRLTAMEFLRQLINGTKAIELVPYLDEIVECICDPFIISRDSLILQSAALELISSIINTMRSIDMVKIIEKHYVSTGRLITSLNQLQNKLHPFLEFNVTIDTNIEQVKAIQSYFNDIIK